jgi:hypothetical protein
MRERICTFKFYVHIKAIFLQTKNRVAYPHHLYADPDPSFHFNAYPNPNVHLLRIRLRILFLVMRI